MDDHLSAWAISEAMGKPRRKVHDQWLRWGLLRQPGPDGRWDPDEGDRLAHARTLESEGRRLSRRALLLHRDGFAVPITIRRLAMADVLARLSRPRHKAAQVQWELQGLRKTFEGHRPRHAVLLKVEVEPSHFPEVLLLASDALVDHWYQSVAMQVDVLAQAGEAARIPIRDAMPYEERLALVMCDHLLYENHVRNRLGLAPKAPRYGPPTVGEGRGVDAPLLRGQIPPPRHRG